MTQFSKQEQKQIDSLNKIISSDKILDSTKVSACLSLVKLYSMNNPQKAITFAKQANNLAKHSNNLNNLSSSYGWLGYLYQNIGDNTNALNYYKISFKNKEET